MIMFHPQISKYRIRTFGADVRSGITSVYFTPVAGVGVTMRVHQTAIDSSATGIGSTSVSLNQILTTTTNIASTGTPQARIMDLDLDHINCRLSH